VSADGQLRRARKKHPLDMTPEERLEHTRSFLAYPASATPCPPREPDEEERFARERVFFPYDEVLPTPRE